MAHFVPAVIVGLSVGDALGMPFERHVQSDPQLLEWDGKYRGCDPAHPWNHELGPGQWTDDTQMTLVLADYLIHHPDPQNLNLETFPLELADKYAIWLENNHPLTGPSRGVGGTTRESLTTFRNTGKLSPLDSKGTGPIMRASPYAIVIRDEDKAVEAALADSRITHDNRSVRMAVTQYIRFLHRILRCQEHDKSEWDILFSESSGHTFRGGKMQLIGTALQAAIACFYRTDSFAAAVQMAIRLGGDTDTVGSITGALVGAWYGLEGIPEQYLEGLEKKETILHLNTKLNELGGLVLFFVDLLVIPT